MLKIYCISSFLISIINTWGRLLYKEKRFIHLPKGSKA